MALLLLLTSCHYDDEEKERIDNSYVAGKYNLISWNMPVSIDINGDGRPSHNLIEESDCFTHSAISVNEDFTFTLIHHEVLLKNGNFSCDKEILTGTWSRNGFTLTAVTEAGLHQYDFTAGENPTLIRVIENTTYPTLLNEEPVYAKGNIEMIYERD